MSGDTLKGRRIELRPLAEADAAALAEAVAESRALLRRRFDWVDAAEAPDAFASFLRAGGRGAGDAVFGVFEAKSGRLLGVASLDHAAADGAKAELSLWTRASEQDKGYAVEAGRLLADRAFRRKTLHRLHARIDPTNRAARKVLQKLGFRYEGCLRQDKRLNGRWIDQECWGLLRGSRKR